MDMEEVQREIDQNYIAFQRMLPSILAQRGGQFALMRGGECVAFFDTARDAQIAGQKLYGEGKFSIQEVAQKVVDLGWHSRALS